MKVQFTVTKCTANKDGKFVLTLVVNEEVSVFGMKKMVKRTYYIGGMPAAVEVGKVIEDDMDNFEVKEYEFPHPETAELLKLKWLHAKATFERKAA
jgi:sulfopyruvate decarboxylase TPP-binding subunit